MTRNGPIQQLKVLESLMISIFACGCASDFRPVKEIGAGAKFGSLKTVTEEEIKASGFVVDLQPTNFFHEFSPNSLGCAGSAKTYFKPHVLDASNNPIPFSPDPDEPGATQKPAFINDVSLDLTLTGYRPSGVPDSSNPIKSLSCSFSEGGSTPIPSACAAFDSTTLHSAFGATGALAPPAPALIGYLNSGYYAVFDESCIGSGPFISGDPSVNKALVGGVYIDLDRGFLHKDENLILSLKILPFAGTGAIPGETINDQALFKIHLMTSGMTESELRRALQPRQLTYADFRDFPQIVNSFSILSPSQIGIREEQVLLPISMNPLIDRIRIERQVGSGILISAAVHRMRAS